MSRHQVPALKPGHEAYVGWDRPLQSFFGQVYQLDLEDEDANPIVWAGADRPRELPSVFDLVEAMAGHVDLTSEMRRMLYLDMELGR